MSELEATRNVTGSSGGSKVRELMLHQDRREWEEADV